MADCMVGAPVKNFALLFCAYGTHHAEDKRVGPFFLILSITLRVVGFVGKLSGAGYTMRHVLPSASPWQRDGNA